MDILVDTSVLGRLANSSDASYPVATRAIAELHRAGEMLQIAPQSLIEFRAFATRPSSVNGLGLAAASAEALAATFESKFSLLSETQNLYLAWKTIVHALGVVGKQVHDARLVAACHVHGIGCVLTFNVAHFNRLVRSGPQITVLDPAKV